MIKHKWLSVETFSELHGVSTKTIYSRKHTKSIPSYAFYKEANYNTLMIDEYFFVRRRKFKDAAIKLSQNMYYLLTSKYSEIDIGKAVNTFCGINANSSAMYINNSLFRSTLYNDILNTPFSEHEWAFYRFCLSVKRGLETRLGYKLDLEQILDDMMED